jgi:hypothetical protein
MVGSRRERWAIALRWGALGCVVLVAGCGGTEFARPATPPVPAPVATNPALQATLARSVSRTSAERSARTAVSVTLTGLGNDAVSSGAFDIAGTGVVDFANGNADLDVNIPQFDRAGGGGAIEQRIVGGVVYTRLPPVVLKAGGLPASVRWLSLDPARSGGDPSALSQAQVNPAGQLALLALASARVRKVGSDVVRGVPATHYTTTIELAPTLAGAAPDAARARAVLGSVVGGRPITADVWLDRLGCARRVVLTIPLATGAGGGELGALGPDAMMRIQGDFFAFGTPVRVVAPPRGQVRSFSALRIAAPAG